MIYSKNTREKLVNRVILLMVVSLVLGCLVGFGVSKVTTKDNTVSCDVFGSKLVDNKKEVENLKFSDYKYIKKIPLTKGQQEYVYSLCKAYNIDYAFILGVMETESNFNNATISTTDDYGIMQLNAITHSTLCKAIGVKEVKTFENNVHGGIYMFSVLFNKYNDTNHVLMAYNMGVNGSNIAWKQGIRHTHYTDVVNKNIKKWKKVLTNDNE